MQRTLIIFKPDCVQRRLVGAILQRCEAKGLRLAARKLLGATSGVVAAPGTIRGDFSISKQNNLVHGSDSAESAAREIALWFRPEEVVDYRIAGEEWVS